ncbi:MAG: hypothetical protein N2323_04895 [candidate division WOR-3 bacterium]|nr:hypothetical protein [candidate division WOR-3 bacterium]MCX7837279.1 hypothetical protein [candidate division WOR-3 bacterium]MDW8113717.1 hypothetical protein [candidate division WOR-3 bacterium]
MKIRNFFENRVKKNLREWNIDDPHPLENCLSTCRKVKEKVIKEENFNQIIINFGGGSKILSLALFYVIFEEFWEKDDVSNIPLVVYYTYKDGENIVIKNVPSLCGMIQ